VCNVRLVFCPCSIDTKLAYYVTLTGWLKTPRVIAVTVNVFKMATSECAKQCLSNAFTRLLVASRCLNWRYLDFCSGSSSFMVIACVYNCSLLLSLSLALVFFMSSPVITARNTQELRCVN